MEFRSGILQDVVQLVSLVANIEHNNVDWEDEEADWVPTAYKDIRVGEVVTGGDADYWWVQEGKYEASTGDHRNALSLYGSIVILLIVQNWLLPMLLYIIDVPY